MATLDDGIDGALVNEHGAEEHVIGPFDVLITERVDIHVGYAEFPVAGEHAGDGEQTEGRESCAF